MSTCDNCQKWLVQRVTEYEDGSRIANFKAADGKGLCEVLSVETPADFGCNQYVEGHEHIEVMGHKSGSPWHHSTRITCPDCKGTGVVGLLGDAGCERCCRTGTCLLYDDGYLGEERTRRHPNEVPLGPPPPPSCPRCARVVQPDWLLCPWCPGQELKSQIEPIRIQEFIP